MYKFPLLVTALVFAFNCGYNEAKLTDPSVNLGKIRVVERPAAESKNRFYVSNREPLLPSPFIKLPIRSIDPKGWLRKQLELQAEGFHGHLTEISRFLKKENNAWLSKEGLGEQGWEEVPYWLKGFSNCAYVLDNEDMIAEARIWIESALNSQKTDGWFGPDKGRGGLATRLKGREDLWPNMIMLFCLQGYYDYTGDERVIKLMTSYMKYLTTVPEDKFIVGYWPKMRAADLSFSIYWLYNRTSDEFLLDLGHKVHRRTAEWSKDVINWHNVNMSQAFGGPTTYYMQSKNPIHLEASYRNWQKMRDTYGRVPGGMFGGDENCRPGYTGPRQAIETCGTVEMMLSHETLLTITGDPVWADRCEDVAFNTMPAGFTADMKALRYLTSPNMVQSDSKNKSPGLQNGGPMLHMNPHGHRCCQHNIGHGWPYYAQHLWLATPDNGLAAVLYSASEVTAKVGDGTEITIAEKTRYPFEEEIVFTVSTAKSVPFPLYLRIPAWCKNSAAKVNGKSIERTAPPGTYLIIDRNWSDGDTLTLTLPMEISLRTWTKNNNSVSVDRGPLTYSLKIGEKYVRHGGTDDWPAWEIYPTTPWNYGLVLNETDPANGFEVDNKSWPKDNQPFGVNAAPIELKTKAKRIPQWKQDHLGLVGLLQPSPVKSDEPTETITLVPMGSARLRIASFPTIGAGSDAHEWTDPPLPFKGMASHCFGSDSIEAIQDGLEPKHSNDHDIPRFTWWPRKDSREWIQYKLDKPKQVSRIEVYWFDDTGVGGCRTPQSWRLLYKDGDTFKEVPNPSSYGIEKDKYNLTTFDPVTTSLLRIEVKLKSEFSGGILEVKVK
jgi:beta-L-arabinofuranosidase (glycosyl hydrolase family 127)/glycosyl hydrolase family 127 (putative beta-L-arabinofuranosidase)